MDLFSRTIASVKVENVNDADKFYEFGTRSIFSRHVLGVSKFIGTPQARQVALIHPPKLCCG